MSSIISKIMSGSFQGPVNKNFGELGNAPMNFMNTTGAPIGCGVVMHNTTGETEAPHDDCGCGGKCGGKGRRKLFRRAKKVVAKGINPSGFTAEQKAAYDKQQKQYKNFNEVDFMHQNNHPWEWAFATGKDGDYSSRELFGCTSFCAKCKNRGGTCSQSGNRCTCTNRTKKPSDVFNNCCGQ